MAGGYDIGASLALSNASSASNASAFEVRDYGSALSLIPIAVGLALVGLVLWLVFKK